ncbi:MAG: ATP-binding protein [Saccharofermentanales bacterium]
MIRKFNLIIAFLLTAGFLSAAAVSYNALDDFNRRTTEIRLSDAIRLVSTELDKGASNDEIDQYIREVMHSESEKIRITLIAITGKVLYDSDTEEESMDDHIDRPEIAKAIASGDKGVAIRKSDTLGIDTFYLAETDEKSGHIIRAALPMSVYVSIVEISVRQMLFIFVAFALILLLTGLIASRLTAAPVIRLKNAAERMAEGDYSVRIEARRSDRSEIAELSRSFDHMARELEVAHDDLIKDNIRLDMVLNAIENPVIAVDDELQVTFINKETEKVFLQNDLPHDKLLPMISVIRSVETEELVRSAYRKDTSHNEKISIISKTGRRVYRVNVSLSNSSRGKTAIIVFQDVSQIEEMAKLRSDFVAGVTHELKTPLTSIRGFIDTLRNKDIDDPAVRNKFLDIIDVEAERLNDLINDILVLSEIEEMKTENEYEEFDLNALTDEVVVLLDDEASRNKISVISGASEELIDQEAELMIKANRNRIKQILINLIENAIRYNIEGGKVIVESSRPDDEHVVINVSDTGQGIPAEHLPRIFERFYRVDKGRSRELGGTGLGLSIVKHIAMLYEGSVSAQSTPGEGTVISVILRV